MEKREKIVLVTGSTGFLGSAITRRLLASGYKLRLLIRKRNYDASPTSFGWELTAELWSLSGSEYVERRLQRNVAKLIKQ